MRNGVVVEVLVEGFEDGGGDGDGEDEAEGLRAPEGEAAAEGDVVRAFGVGVGWVGEGVWSCC